MYCCCAIQTQEGALFSYDFPKSFNFELLLTGPSTFYVQKTMADCDSIHDNVKDYYGSVIQKNTDLQTNACNVAGSVKPPLSVRNAIASVHDEVVST